MPSPPPPSTVTPSSIFDSQPRSGLSRRTIIILASALSATLFFTISLATIHTIRKRQRSKAQHERKADIEASLQHARPPILTIDTHVPRIHELQRSAQGPLSNPRLAREMVTPVPSMRGHAPTVSLVDQHVPMPPMSMCAVANPSVRHERSSTRKASNCPGVGGRSPTRNASRAPGIGGRNAREGKGGHVVMDSGLAETVEPLRPTMPVLPGQVWDPQERRVLVLR